VPGDSPNFPQTNPQDQSQQYQKQFFPFKAFQFDDPNVTNPPTLALSSPWLMKASGTFSGTGTGLTNAIADTAANMASNNPVLLKGQLGYETDTKYFKIGDGSTAYNSLGYVNAFLISSTVYKFGIWYDYVPTTQGLGTIGSTKFQWKRDFQSGSIWIMGKTTVGTTTGSELQIGLPLSQTSDSTLVPSIMPLGILARSASATFDRLTAIESNKGYIVVTAPSGGGLTKVVGTAIGTGETIVVAPIAIPINGWNV